MSIDIVDPILVLLGIGLKANVAALPTPCTVQNLESNQFVDY